MLSQNFVAVQIVIVRLSGCCRFHLNLSNLFKSLLLVSLRSFTILSTRTININTCNDSYQVNMVFVLTIVTQYCTCRNGRRIWSVGHWESLLDTMNTTCESTVGVLIGGTVQPQLAALLRQSLTSIYFSFMSAVLSAAHTILANVLVWPCTFRKTLHSYHV